MRKLVGNLNVRKAVVNHTALDLGLIAESLAREER